MHCEELWKIFHGLDIDFFTGVPDSTFKGWMTFLTEEHKKRLTNIIASNECEAIAIAVGYYLATGKIGVVYMQNAGEGKTVNPITSLCDSEVYSIPMLLMIGWRGELGKVDEPQHKKMGQITTSLLELLGIPFAILPENARKAKKTIQEIICLSISKEIPVAIIIKKEIVEEYSIKDQKEFKYEMKREEVIKIIVDNLEGDEAILTTTGKTSRELFEYRISRGEKPRDFYTVGGMGCCASIALGIALNKPQKKIIVIDGDGSILMQMGSLATIGHYKPDNLFHILINNRSHESTGGQPTVSNSVNFVNITEGCGYKFVREVHTKTELRNSIREMKRKQGPIMLIVNVAKGARTDLGRPTTTPIQNKNTFMDFLRQ